MKSVICFFNTLNNPRIFKISMLLFFLSSFIIHNKWFGQQHLLNITNGINMIDMNLLNTPTSIYAQLKNMGTNGRAIYSNLLLLDYFVIFAFGLFQTLALLRLTKITTIPSRYSFIILLPLSRGVLDAFENILLFYITKNFPSMQLVSMVFASIVIFLKWLAFYFTILVLLLLAIINIYQKIIVRRRKIYEK